MNTKRHTYYDVVISSLAVVSVILIIIDYSDGLWGWKLWLNRGLWIVFIADFVTRYQRAPKKAEFIQRNFYDLLAVIPFHGIFMPAPVIELDRLLRVLNLLRLIGFLARPLRKANKFFDTNGFKYVLLATVILIFSGGFLIQYAEGMTLSDGIWWAFVTATTVGYGDISPNTFYGRMIAMLLMLVGIGLLGSVTSTLTSYFMNNSSKRDKKTNSVKSQTLSVILEELEHFDELSNDDVDEICRLLKTMKKKE